MEIYNNCQGCDCETPCAPVTPARNGIRFITKISEDNRTKCRDCGGKGKPSTALMNFHDRRRSFRRGEAEFRTEMVSCLKCSDCGHSWN